MPYLLLIDDFAPDSLVLTNLLMAYASVRGGADDDDDDLLSSYYLLSIASKLLSLYVDEVVFSILILKVNSSCCACFLGAPVCECERRAVNVVLPRHFLNAIIIINKRASR